MKRILKYGLYTIISVFLLLNIVVAFHAYKFTHFYDDIPAPMKGSMEMSVSEKFGAILFGLDVPKSKDTLTADGSFQPVLLKTDEGLLIKAWLASADSSKGTVILFHGHGSSASKMTPEAMAFKAMGYSVMLVDFRAHGNSEGNTCTIGYTETEEVKLAYNNIRQRNEKNIILWGISMGAATVCAAVPQYGLKPQKIILEMPFGTLHEAAGGRIRMMGLPAEPFGTLVTFWGGVEQGFWAFNFRPCESVKKVYCPVLLQWGKKDPRVTWEETECIFNQLASGEKKLVVYPTAAHESLFKKEPQRWMDEVSRFLDQ